MTRSILIIIFLLGWSVQVAVGQDPAETEVDSTGIELYQRAGHLINVENDFAKGDSLMLEAREKLRDTPFWDTYGATYLAIGFSYYLQRRSLGEITEQLHKGLGVVNRNTDEPHRLRAMLYDNLTYAFRDHSATDSARVYIEKAIEEGLLALEGEHMMLQGQFYGNAASVYGDLGILSRALEYYNKAEEIFSRMLPEDHRHWSTHYANLGALHRRLGDRVASEQYYNRAIELAREIFGERHMDYQQYRMDQVELTMMNGEFETALKHIREIIPFLGEHYPESDLYLESQILKARTLLKLERYEEALEAAEYSVNTSEQMAGWNRQKYRAYKIKATILLNMGRKEEADRQFANADEKVRRIPSETEHDRAALYIDMARAYLEHGYIEESILYAEESLLYSEYKIISRDFDGREVEMQITHPENSLNVHALLGEAYAAKYDQTGERQHLDRAMTYFADVADQSWEIRRTYREQASSLDLSERLTDVFRSGMDSAYDGYQNTGDEAYLDKLMLFAQNSKATTLQNSLIQSQILEAGSLPVELQQEKQVLQSEITHREIQLARAQSDRVEMDADLQSEYERSLFDLRHQRDRLLDSIRTRYSDFYNLYYENLAVSSDELQQQLEQGEVLIEYAGSDEGIYIIVTDHGSTRVEKVEVSERELKDVVTQFHELSSNRTVVRATIRRQLYELNDTLYEWLIAPVSNRIAVNERWVVIPDGPLHFIPIDMLINPEKRTDEGFEEQPFLIRDHIISYNYSPGLFAMQVKRPQEHRSRRITAFAPVFDDIEGTESFIDAVSYDMTLRSDLASGTYEFAPLPASREEVEQIAEIAKQFNLETKLFLDDEANREAVISGLEGDIVHIATHGVFNAEIPSLSGIAVRDPGNEERPNSMMYVPEVYNISLDADLVVLSSCESGFGEVVRGEGMIAMNRGFIQAGSNNVVYSLWKVSDTHTRDLMTKFYRHHLEGADYAEALRNAKLEMLDGATTAIPAHWAAFLLIGA